MQQDTLKRSRGRKGGKDARSCVIYSHDLFNPVESCLLLYVYSTCSVTLLSLLNQFHCFLCNFCYGLCAFAVFLSLVLFQVAVYSLGRLSVKKNVWLNFAVHQFGSWIFSFIPWTFCFCISKHHWISTIWPYSILLCMLLWKLENENAKLTLVT